MSTNNSLKRFYVYYNVAGVITSVPFHKLIFAATEDEATTKFFNMPDTMHATITKITRSEYTNKL